MKIHCRQFVIRPGIEKAHQRSGRIGLAVRRWMEEEKLTAWTVNFLDVTRKTGLPTVPFLEASLGMARGIGYAGEGDVLTAALVGALTSVFPDTTFTEMFCPDWKGQTIFLSHMGEVNINLLSDKPVLMEYPFVFGKVGNPVKPAGCLRGGKAVFVNLAPLPDYRFRLILAPVTMKQPKGRDNFTDAVRGWMQPALRISDFLEVYSRAGGTHHAALVYDADMNILSGLGTVMGWETVVIRS
jgi:L-arabinose isomerase